MKLSFSATSYPVLPKTIMLSNAEPKNCGNSDKYNIRHITSSALWLDYLIARRGPPILLAVPSTVSRVEGCYAFKFSYFCWWSPTELGMLHLILLLAAGKRFESYDFPLDASWSPLLKQSGSVTLHYAKLQSLRCRELLSAAGRWYDWK